MLSRTHRPWSLRMITAVVTLALTLTACGGSSGPTAPAAATTLSDLTAALPTGGGALPTDTDDSASEPADGGASTGAYDPNRMAALDMSVRVVNLYVPKGAQLGSAIEAWVGSPGNGGKKLQTIPYGQVSDYFAPQVTDPTGAGQTDPHTSYSLGFYAAGNTTSELIDQGENSSPGQKLTMVVAPNEPSADGASLQVFLDDLGSSPSGGGFTKLSVPTPPAGSALLSLNALAMEYRGTDPTSPDSLTPSTTGGKCIQYIESETGKVHDPNSDTTEFFGGTSSQNYVVAPGTQVRINVVGSSQSVTEACAAAPAIGPVDPKLTAGQRAYGFVYGQSMKAAKLLLVPIG